MLATGGHSWSQVVTPGHRWSHLVTGGHTWSQVVTLVTIIPVTPEHYSSHRRDAKKHYTLRNLNFPPFSPLMPWPSLVIPATPKHFSRHPRHAKTLFAPFPTRQNTILTIPRTHCILRNLNFPPFSPPCIGRLGRFRR